MRDWRELLVGSVSLPNRRDMDPPQREALERSQYPDEIFWLEVHDVETAQHVEAVELLARLAQVDYALWRSLVGDLWSLETEWVEFFSARQALRVGLQFRLFDVDREVAAFCVFLSASLSSERSASYKETFNLMESVRGKSLVPLSGTPVWLYVSVEDTGFVGRDRNDRHEEDQDHSSESEDETMGSSIQRTHGGGMSFRSEGGRQRNQNLTSLSVIYDMFSQLSGEAKTTMRLTHFTLEPRYISVNETVLHTLVAIRNLDIQVVGMPSVRLDVGGSTLRDALRCFQSLLHVADGPHNASESDNRVNGVEEYSIRSLGAGLSSDLGKAQALVPGVFSAIQASRSLGRIFTDVRNTTKPGFPRQRMIWWMTYGLFCRPPLKTIDMGASDLSLQDIEHMAQIWHSTDPLAMLFPESTDGIVGSVIASQVYLHQPEVGANSPAPANWIHSTTTELEVIGESRGGILPVLLPGWGKAWVKEGEVSSLKISTSRRSMFQSPTHILLRGATSYDMVLALVRLIGRGLKYLSIPDPRFHFPESPLQPYFVEQILRACPHLEELDLFEFTGLQALVRAIRSGQNTRLERLKIHAIHEQKADEIIDFMAALTDPHDTVAKQLKKLRFSARLPVERRQLDAVVGMLRSNTRLHKVGLEFLCDPDLVCEYAPLLDTFRLSPGREPLPVRCALAFLSTVRPGVARDAPCQRWGAFEQFDSRILSTIVAFAASPHFRSVYAVLYDQF